MAESPYKNLRQKDWLKKTEELVATHPVPKNEWVQIVLQAWHDIFDSSLGPKKFRIGEHIFPKPQIMGFLLHELIPLELESRYPNLWCGDRCATDKDLVYLPDDRFSVELKTSSHASQIFANRSYAQESSEGKKNKSGYYLAANFGKFSPMLQPEIVMIRFGWIDHSDWIGQEAATGQQAHLSKAAYESKLLTLYPAKSAV